MPTVFANGRSILTQGDGFTQVCSVPDVCDTPSPGGPVPVPYVNVAMDSDLADGTQKVKVDGTPAALAGSNLRMSTGDEAGSAGGGLISRKIKGKCTFGLYSFDVKMEGQGVVRFLDITQHNGNTFNTALFALGLANPGGPVPSGMTYGDDVEKCPVCGKDTHPSHAAVEHKAAGHSKDLATGLMDALVADGLGSKFERGGEVGYMLGVLYCTDGTKFAATSGRSPSKDGKTFKETAEGQGFAVPTQVYSPARLVTRGNSEEHEVELPHEEGKNPPLMCAAPKLVQLALRAGKMNALCCMTEIWVFKKSNGQNGRDVTVTTPVVVRGEHEFNATENYSHGETVPSCDTCKDNLPRVLCPES